MPRYAPEGNLRESRAYRCVYRLTVDFENRFFPWTLPFCFSARTRNHANPYLVTSRRIRKDQVEQLLGCIASIGVLDFRVNVKYCKSRQNVLGRVLEAAGKIWLSGLIHAGHPFFLFMRSLCLHLLLTWRGLRWWISHQYFVRQCVGGCDLR